MTVEKKWWKEASVYQIWPASYKDSNGDGVGDIPGIISTLDYVKDLGVDVIWLSPMYDSPQDDMGYDISDYENVYPKYGTLEDMQNLIDETHKRGMKLILDLVINHTSSEHKWFKESRSSKTNPKRDWYIWQPAKYDAEGKRHPPNNWRSYFSESAWTYDETTDEYYLHLFAESQPDLNWENEETREAIYKSALTFWYEKGVDGFRIDTAGIYSKVQTYKDAPIVIPDSEWQPCGMYHENGPRIHEFHKEMFAKTTSKYDAMTVGEGCSGSKEEALKYISAKEKEMNMMFLFDTICCGRDLKDLFNYIEFDLTDFKKATESQSSFAEGTDAWTTVFLENHDSARSISRFGNPSKQYRTQSGKALALLQSTLTGTQFIYQGQEIGMINLPRSWSLEEYQDINTINYVKQFKQKHENDPNYAVLFDKLMDNIQLLARDHARSPVQWNSSANAGFTTGEPWTRVNDNYKEINAESQIDDPNSLLSFWKQALKLRKEYKELFIYGSCKFFDMENKKTFTYVKSNGGQKAFVTINFSTETVPLDKYDIDGDFKLLLCNSDIANEQSLEPYEARVYLIE